MPSSEFEKLIDLPRKCMRITGLWPESRKKINSRFKIFECFFILTFFIIVPQTTKLIDVINNLFDIVNIMLIGLTIAVITVLKLFHQWHMVEEFYELNNAMEKDWEITDDFKKSQMMKNLPLVKFMVKCSTYGTLITALIFIVIKLTTSFHRSVETSNNSTVLQFFVESRFFFDSQISPFYEMIWLGQLVSAFIICFIYPDGFFFISVFHLCSQLDILRFDVKNLVALSKERNFNGLIANIIDKHLQLKRFSETIEKVYNKIFLLQMIFYSICLCLQGYSLITLLSLNEKDVPLILFVVDFLVTQLFSLFVTCYVAERLRDKSLKFFYEVSNINYYNLKATQLKSLVIIMCASQTPFELTAGKFAVLSLEYYASVLKTALGYITMLRAVIDVES